MLATTGRKNAFELFGKVHLQGLKTAKLYIFKEGLSDLHVC